MSAWVGNVEKQNYNAEHDCVCYATLLLLQFACIMSLEMASCCSVIHQMLSRWKQLTGPGAVRLEPVTGDNYLKELAVCHACGVEQSLRTTVGVSLILSGSPRSFAQPGEIHACT